MKKTLLIASICLFQHSIAQKHAMNWYFGTQAGISFKTYPPTPITDGAIIQREGNATISDEQGNLLFYTDGSIVWNKNHAKMKNGTGLSGQQIAAQSCIIAQQPKNPNIYYLFTVSDWQNASGNLSYSIVDIRKDGGLGEVIEKNVLVNNKCREQVSAVYANESGDVWILSHEKNTDFFVNYKLTENGLNSSPVRSKVGTKFEGKNRYGQLKFSANGQKVCSTLGGNTKNTVQVFDFDSKTGKLSNAMIIVEDGIMHAYSSEFSPNGKVLYVSSFNQPDLFQFDLASDNQKSIQKSKINLSQNNKIKSCLQIGYDQKIYVSKDRQSELGVINKPDIVGEGCKYDDQGIKFPDGSQCRLGFPNFIQSYFKNYLELEMHETFLKDKIKLEPKTNLKSELEEQVFMIHFKSGSSSINSESAEILDEIILELKKNPGYRVAISSHTDCTGSASSNLALSQKRAKSTANYLNDKMEVSNNSGIGYGETKPVTSCECSACSDQENALNRRTEIKLIPVK